MLPNAKQIVPDSLKTAIEPVQPNSRFKPFLVGIYYLVAIFIISLAFLLPAAPTAQADNNSFVVTNSQDNGWDANPPPNSLRAAIVAANALSSTNTYTITFSFASPTTITLQGALPKIGVKLAIIGPTNQQITISGGGLFQPFYVEGANGLHGQLTMSNLTIAHGKAFDYGGAIFNHQNTTILNNMTFYDNNAPFRGGAIMSDLGTLLINNTTFYSNSVTSAEGPFGGDGGGAIYIHPYWPVASSQISVSNSTFYSNAVYPRSVQEGGGSGGAILNAVSTYKGTPVQGRLYIKNSVVAHNFADYGTGPDISSNNYFTSTTGLYQTGGYNFIGDGSDVGGDLNGTPPQDGVNGDRVGTHANPLDPMLGAFQNNGGPAFTIAPLPGSPLIDAANPAGCKDSAKTGGTPVLLTTDGRLFPRTNDSLGTGTARCDIGAFEVQAPQVAFSHPTVAFVLGNNPLLLQAAGSTVSDLDQSSFNGSAFTVSEITNGAAGDVLGLNNEGNGAGQIGVSGNVISYGGVPIATFSAASGPNAALTISFNNNGVTPAIIQSIVNNMTFAATQAGAGTRAINFVLNDNTGGHSKPARLQITVGNAPCTPTTVTAAQDDGTGTTCGTLSFALAQGSGSNIIFNLPTGISTVTMTGNLTKQVARNVTIYGGNCATSSGILIDGNGKTGGLALSGNDTLTNLWIKNFATRQLYNLPGAGGNVLRCVRVTDNVP